MSLQSLRNNQPFFPMLLVNTNDVRCSVAAARDFQHAETGCFCKCFAKYFIAGNSGKQDRARTLFQNNCFLLEGGWRRCSGACTRPPVHKYTRDSRSTVLLAAQRRVPYVRHCSYLAYIIEETVGIPAWFFKFTYRLKNVVAPAFARLKHPRRFSVCFSWPRLFGRSVASFFAQTIQ